MDTLVDTFENAGQTVVDAIDKAGKAVVDWTAAGIRAVGIDSDIDHWKKIKKCSELKIGDHVCQTYKAGIFVQGIVVDISTEIDCFTFIRYVFNPDDNEKATILPQTVNLKEYPFEKAVYVKEYYSQAEVVQRAYYRVGESNYDPVFNYARAFPRWCKTGSGGLTSSDERVESTRVEAKICDLKRGDHVAFQTDLGYCHHAIVTEVVDGSAHVVEYVNKKQGKNSGKFIQKNKITNGSGKMYKLRYKHSDAPKVVVKRAEDLAKIYEDTKGSEEKGKKFSYNLLTKNCEHLATWCKTGKWYSAQVKKALDEALEHVLGSSSRHIFKLLGRSLEGVIASLLNIRIDFIVKNVDIFGVLFFISVELVLFFKDAYYFYNKYHAAKDEPEKKQIIKEFEKMTQRRIFIITGATVGSILGASFGPIGIGIGGIVGGLVGELCDWLVNTLQRMDLSQFTKWFNDKACEAKNNMEDVINKECPGVKIFLEQCNIIV